MSDNITLPRELAEKALEAFYYAERNHEGGFYGDSITALRAALAAEQPKHPGYIIGSHWLETAYSRICAGEAEADVLRDCGWERVDEALRLDAERYRWLLKWLVWRGLLSLERCRIDTPESYGDWWILRKPKVIDGSSLIGYGKTEDGAIDAAMGEKQ